MTQLEKSVAKNLLLFAITLIGCRFTNGAFVGLLAIMGCAAAISGNAKWTVFYFVFLPMLIFLSSVLAYGAYLGNLARIGQIAMLVFMLLSPTLRNRRESIPIGLLFVYSIVAIVSSIDGWMPIISYLKILNFVLFILGIAVIGKMMQNSDEALFQLRSLMLSFAFFIIVGSAVAYFIPSVGYSMEVQKAAIYGIYTTGAEIAAREGQLLFSGVMNHSQTLATNVPLWFAWTMCDMLRNEDGKVPRIHAAILVVAPFLMYLSRSRTAFVVLAVSLVMIWLYLLPKIQIAARAKARIKMAFYFIVFAIIVGILVSQIRNQTLSKWLRKSDDVAGDTRGLMEAVIETRMGLVEYNLNDFKLNPIFGKGFQVMSWHGDAYKTGRISLLSAPIEKGVLPLMVIGETGVVGGIVFFCFLIAFYGACSRKHYMCLMVLFTALLAANMSEASFFSPGGGAAEWTPTVIGGFCLDMITKRRRVWLGAY